MRNEKKMNSARRKEPVNEITGDLLRRAKDAQRQVHYEQGNAVFEMVSGLTERRFSVRGVALLLLLCIIAGWLAGSHWHSRMADLEERVAGIELTEKGKSDLIQLLSEVRGKVEALALNEDQK
tara:strand:+ start:208 stop:576 length:369 start_codon:yes stop_codon:yes gene_type:complete